jgi:hypothetical protein
MKPGAGRCRSHRTNLAPGISTVAHTLPEEAEDSAAWHSSFLIFAGLHDSLQLASER